MKTTTVHILATVRNVKLLHSALLVFKTLRQGFPNAGVHVYGNGLTQEPGQMVAEAARAVGASFNNIPKMTHGKWIETLVLDRTEPFWICDTDVVFFKEIERGPHWRRLSTLFAGRYEPEFIEEWTRTRHVARLHPSLMWFNPQAVRAAMRCWPEVHEFFLTVKREFFEWQFVPRGSETLFYDTCAGLYQALGGTPFTVEENACFEHLHCGSYSDLIGPHLSLEGPMSENHRAIYMQPELARGMQKEQAEYYKAHAAGPQADKQAT